MSRGTVPPSNARILGLEASNAVLRAELYSRRTARRGLWLGLAVISAVAGFGAGKAFGETISIGGVYINGSQQAATTVTLARSDEPGELATVTLKNAHVNDGNDTGTYWLTLDGLTVEVDFTWDADPLLGSDRITVYPPGGITCEPQDCAITVMEGFSGQVVLFDWRGM